MTAWASSHITEDTKNDDDPAVNALLEIPFALRVASMRLTGQNPEKGNCVVQTGMVSPVGGEQTIRYHSLGLL